LIAIVGGCKKAAEIRDYTVEKQAEPPKTDRMLAAIVPQKPPEKAGGKSTSGELKTDVGPMAWFFKIVGPVDEVERASAAFDQFVASIRTTEEGRPEWKLPEGWKEDTSGRPAEFGREATIRIGEGSKSLELTVSRLPMPEGRRESWMLQNFNRWRGQLRLSPLARSELDEFTKKIKAGDETALVVNFVGAYSGPPAAGMMAAMGDRGALPTGHPPINGKADMGSTPAPPQGPAPFDADVPADWKPGRINSFRVAAYNVGDADGSKPAEVLVTPLGPSAGDLIGNVNRWRSEINLPDATADEIKAQTKTIAVAGENADYVHVTGPEDASPREATLGVILRRPDRVWFFKMRGPVGVVEQHKEEFESYVKSVKFK